MYPLTPWVKRLLVANVVVFLATDLLGMRPLLFDLGAFQGATTHLRPWSVVTYMFLHAGFMHLLFNMIGLFFFGPRLETRLGSRDFLVLYFGSGIGAALLTLAVGGVGVLVDSAVLASAFFAPTVGASGAVFGILTGFALYWPREEIYIWGVLPVQARWLVLALVAGALVFGVTGTQAGVAHFAHLGGAVVGFLYLRIRDWRVGRDARAFRRKVEATPSAGASGRENMRRWEAIAVDSLHEINREEVERLVGKARREGPRSLTEQERAFLDRMTS